NDLVTECHLRFSFSSAGGAASGCCTESPKRFPQLRKKVERKILETDMKLLDDGDVTRHQTVEQSSKKKQNIFKSRCKASSVEPKKTPG
uniref:Uncharacterized protein n=1 Tax=Seriola dumerili TaxID=41447 RepID=A0A3B4TLX5_SERDU